MAVFHLASTESAREDELARCFAEQEKELIVESMGALYAAADTVLLVTRPARSRLVARTIIHIDETVHVPQDSIVFVLVKETETELSCDFLTGPRNDERPSLVQHGFFPEESPHLQRQAKIGSRWVVVDWGDTGVSVSEVPFRQRRDV
jgi:hypothetical protein